MLEDVSQEEGRNTEEHEKTDRVRERDDRHGGGSSGRCGGVENGFVVVMEVALSSEE